jgi:hypothetical protein
MNPTQIDIGLSVDDLLRIPGRSGEFVAIQPRIAGRDAEGLIAEWTYPDYIVTLRRVGGRYRVHAIREVEEGAGANGG